MQDSEECAISIKHGLFREAASQKFVRVVWNLILHYRVRKSPPLTLTWASAI
jgi:hypothetical protein